MGNDPFCFQPTAYFALANGAIGDSLHHFKFVSACIAAVFVNRHLNLPKTRSRKHLGVEPNPNSAKVKLTVEIMPNFFNEIAGQDEAFGNAKDISG